MSFKASSLLGPALLGVAVAWPAIPQAATETRPIHPFYSSLRLHVLSGLPIPITFAPMPRGRVRPPGPAVTVQQGTTPATTNPTLPSGRSIAMAPTRMMAPPTKAVRFLHPLHGLLLQINTSIAVYWPLASATLRAGGRTGPATVSFCAGDTVTTNYNPGCTGPGNGAINGRMIYNKTFNQFGGPANARFEGSAELAFRGVQSPPCSGWGCSANWAAVKPAQSGAGGNYFGFYNTTPGYTINPGKFRVVAGYWGSILYMTPTGMGPGIANGATSFGGPWTTGRVHIQVTAGDRLQTFTLTGSDTRVNGEGIISLVQGTLSNRILTGPEANPGWLTLYVPEPGATLGAVGALLMLAACHGLVRRRSR